MVFCGNPEFALPTLQALLASSHEVAAVVTSPDQPQGRGRKLAAMPVKAFAEERGVRVLSPAKLRDESFLAELKLLAPDALVVVAFRILPRSMFALPKWGSLNVHPSLLPKCRGPAPIQWTLLRGESETGVTIIRLTEEIDGGGMLAQERVEIGDTENFGSLHDRLALRGAEMLVGVLDQLESAKSVTPIPQDESLVTPAPKLTSEDFVLDFRLPSAVILNRIRAFSPLPGAVARAEGFSLKVLGAEYAGDGLSLSAGQIQWTQDHMYVGTADHAVSLKSVKPAGKREMSIADFLRGRPQLPIQFD
ncbi:MAG: methionyl-tRNA formyltransferase [Calditrichaeota bacterium]|nr:methionyl-tRNA formyltransferase [Calditrichota bacterium]